MSSASSYFPTIISKTALGIFSLAAVLKCVFFPSNFGLQLPLMTDYAIKSPDLKKIT